MFVFKACFIEDVESLFDVLSKQTMCKHTFSDWEYVLYIEVLIRLIFIRYWSLKRLSNT